MKTRRHLGIFFIAATMIVLTSGCIVSFPIESIFRDPDQLRGIVVDQDDKPVSEAKLFFDEWERVPVVPIPFSDDITFSRARRAKTDKSGEFSLSFKRQDLSLKTIEKPGFIFEPFVTPNSWERRILPAQKSLRHCGKFVLYRISGVDTSSVTNVSSPIFKFTTDGTDYYLNLVSQQVTTLQTDESDLMFSVKQVGPETWLVTIRAIEGGVWASRNEMPYAPQGDYVSGFSTFYSMGYAICYRVQYDFFAKTQGGRHYSRIVVDLHKKPQTIQFHYVLNNNGGRFLFVPESVNHYGFHGPPYFKERDHGAFNDVIHGDGIPWWRKQDHNVYPMLPETTFMALAELNGKDPWSRRYVAQQLYAPVSVLDKISNSTVWQERMDVAENPATPADILKRLSSDSNATVRQVANETLSHNWKIRTFLNSKGYSRTSN